ncbi:MAG: TIGR02530 family flagellar biosynthesis protein [Bdellovibrionales bacterium]
MKSDALLPSRISPATGVGGQTPSLRGPREDGSAFREALSTGLEQTTGPSTANSRAIGGLKFSNHAIDRMQRRGIRFSPEDLARIEGAVAKAHAKGAKECLLLNDQAAMIVSLKDNTVVTVMDKNQLKENVFTNIDSTVVI